MENTNFSEIIRNFISLSDEKISYLAVNELLMKQLPDILDDSFIFVDLKYDVSPLKPFLSVLKELKPSKDLIDEYGFPLHKEIFNSYFETGLSSRRQDLIFEQEYGYEALRFRETIIKLLEKLNTKKYVFTNAQYLFKESFQILSDLENSTMKGKFVFVFDSVNSELKSKSVRDFLESISSKRNFLHFFDDTLENDKNIPLIQEKNFRKKLHSNYKEIDDFHEVLKTVINNCSFLALDQGEDFCNWINANFYKMNFTNQQKRRLYLEMGITFYNYGKLDEAILLFNNILEFQENDEIEQIATLYLATVFAQKKQNIVAKKYAVQLENQLKDKKSSPLFALAVMMDYYVTPRTNQDTTVEKYRESIKYLEEAGLKNNYVATAVKIPWTLIENTTQREYLHGIIEKCFKYAYELDNQHLISSSCHWNAIILSHEGKNDEAMANYEKCNEIRTKIGEIGPLLAIRNGLSYESLNRARYNDAYDTINDVVPLLYKVSDFATIVDTLKNVAYAIFYCHDFKMADDVLKMILYFMNLFNLENAANNAFLPTVNDILIYKSIIDMDSGDFIHAKMNLTSIMQNGKSISSVDKPVLHFIKAALAVEEKNISEMYKEITLFHDEFLSTSSNQEHKIVFLYFELAQILKNFNYNEESKEFLEKGLTLSEEKRFAYYLQSENLKEYRRNFRRLSELKINLPFLQEKAEKDSLLNQLHNRIYDYQFLNKIKTYNTITSSVKKYLQKVIQAIYEYTMAQAIYVAENTEKGWKELYSVTRDGIDFIGKEAWNNLYVKYIKGHDCQIVYDYESGIYYGNISKFDFLGGIILIPGNTQQLNSDTINIINIALSSIQAQVVMFKQNEYLMKMSSIDQLSQLKNRHALQLHIESVSEKIRKAIERNKTVEEVTIAFFDMDNFKYYNDTFGHETGDLLINRFAAFLEKYSPAGSFVSRFGGDEFIVVMNGTTPKEALKFTDKLYDAIDSKDSLKKEIEKEFRNRIITIPEDKKLSFSVGLSSNMQIEDSSDLKLVMTNSDKALYFAKEHGKHKGYIWKS